MKSCKVVHAQSKSTNVNWYYVCVEGICLKFGGTKKRLANSKEINTCIASSVEKYLKMNKNVNMYDEYDSDNGSEQFNF